MALLLAAAQIAVIACIAGAALFRLPWGDRARRAALSPEERAFWYVVLSLTVSLGAALALAAAGKYTLNRVLLVDIAVAAAAAMGARGRLRLGSTRHVSWGAAAPLAIVILGCWLYFPTAEYVMGGKDPGVYISEGLGYPGVRPDGCAGDRPFFAGHSSGHPGDRVGEH